MLKQCGHGLRMMLLETMVYLVSAARFRARQCSMFMFAFVCH